MDKYEVIEKIAAGLRQLDNKPDYLLCICDDGWIDQPTICDIPVIYTMEMSDSLYAAHDCDFIPCWIDPSVDFNQVYDFIRGYSR